MQRRAAAALLAQRQVRGGRKQGGRQPCQVHLPHGCGRGAALVAGRRPVAGRGGGRGGGRAQVAAVADGGQVVAAVCVASGRGRMGRTAASRAPDTQQQQQQQQGRSGGGTGLSCHLLWGGARCWRAARLAAESPQSSPPVGPRQRRGQRRGCPCWMRRWGCAASPSGSLRDGGAAGAGWLARAGVVYHVAWAFGERTPLRRLVLGAGGVDGAGAAGSGCLLGAGQAQLQHLRNAHIQAGRHAVRGAKACSTGGQAAGVEQAALAAAAAAGLPADGLPKQQLRPCL
jgi:hypothetical protein